MKRLIREAHRRSLWQVLGIYLAGSWVALQVVDQVVQSAGLPEWVPSLALVLALIGLPMVLATAFVQEGMPSHVPDAAPSSPDQEPSAVTSGGPAVESSAPTSPLAATAGGGWLKRNVFTWRNAIAGGVAALALFGAATAVWMVLRGAGVGAAGTLVAKGLIEDGERIILADFEGDSSLAVAATMALRVQLAESGVVSVADPAFVANALERMEVTGGPLGLERAREVAVREGIKAVVGGDVAGAGGRFIVTVHVVETASGNELLTVGETADDSTALLDSVDRVGRRLRERLGESLGSIRETAPLERATTSSTEALRKYSRALDASDARDIDRAIALLDEAIALDSTFAMAWRKLAVLDFDRRKEAATRAWELRDRLTERERYHTVGIYQLYALEDPDAAATTFRALIEAYPDDGIALNNLATTYQQLGQLELAAEIFGRAAELDPYSPHYRNNLVPLLHEIGRTDSARAALGRFAADFPAHPDVATLMSEFAYLDGDLAAVEEALAPLLASAVPAQRRQASRTLTDLRQLRGRLQEAEGFWRTSVEDPSPFREARRRAYLDLDVRRDTAAAIRGMSGAIASAPDSILDDAANGLAGFFYSVGDVERGDAFYARHLAVDSLSLANTPERFRPVIESMHASDRSRALGDYEAALAAGREAEAAIARARVEFDPANWALWSVPMFEALGQADSVIARYERWLGRRQLEGRLGADADWLAAAHERLGQLYDAKGDLESAALHHARFVELWEDADPELQPRVEAARARLEEILRERG
jgi:tetratricopeptide (TPR) repeat protein